jgi:hypothetical protein
MKDKFIRQAPDKLLVDLLSVDNDIVYKIIHGELNQYKGIIHTDGKTYILYYPNTVQWTPILLHARMDTVLLLEKVNVMVDVCQSNKDCPPQDFANRVGVYIILQMLREMKLHCPVLFTTSRTCGMNNAIGTGELDIIEGELHALFDTTLIGTNLYSFVSTPPVQHTNVLDEVFIRRATKAEPTAIEILSMEYNIPAYYISTAVNVRSRLLNNIKEEYCSVANSFINHNIEGLKLLITALPHVSTFTHPARKVLDNENKIYGTAEIDTPIEDFNFEETPRCSICGKRKFPQTYFHQCGNLCQACEKKVRKHGNGDTTFEAWFAALDEYTHEKLMSKIANMTSIFDKTCPACGHSKVKWSLLTMGYCPKCNAEIYLERYSKRRAFSTKRGAPFVYEVETKGRKIIATLPASKWFDLSNYYNTCLLCGKEIKAGEITGLYTCVVSVLVCQECDELIGRIGK